MRKTKVTCDSTCDLPADLIARYDIGVVPNGVQLGDRLYHDGVDIFANDLFTYVDRTGDLPKTSAEPPKTYTELFTRLTSEGYEVVQIGIANGFSTAYQSASIAAKDFENVCAVESDSLSVGSGILALTAAQLAEEGLSAHEIAEKLEAVKPRVRMSFVLTRLDYARKSGRCSMVALLGSNLLKICPEMCVENGSTRLGRKFRGAQKKSYVEYVAATLEDLETIDPEYIILVHSGIDDALLDTLKAQIEQKNYFKQVIVTTAGCTISSHCGPACLGLAFLTK